MASHFWTATSGNGVALFGEPVAIASHFFRKHPANCWKLRVNSLSR